MKIWNKIRNQVAGKPQELFFAILFGWLAIMLVVVCLVILNVVDLKKDTAKPKIPDAAPVSADFKAITSRDSQGVARIDVLSNGLLEKNASGLTGTVQFVEFVDPKQQVFIGLALKGGQEHAVYPAYIYEGTCDKPERQLYSLSPVTNGKTENYLSASMADFKKLFPLAAVVHMPGNEAHIIAACADLTTERTD